MIKELKITEVVNGGIWGYAPFFEGICQSIKSRHISMINLGLRNAGYTMYNETKGKKKMSIIPIILLILFAIAVQNVFFIFQCIKRKEWDIDETYFKICLFALIITPILVFAFIIPKIVIQGEKEIYTQVKYSTGKEYNVMVLFDIEEYENEDGYEMRYYPIEIEWSNGGKSINQGGDSGTVDEWVTLYDQDDKEYEVKITKPTFTFKEQMIALGAFDKLVYLTTFISSAIIALKYLSNKSKSVTE